MGSDRYMLWNEGLDAHLALVQGLLQLFRTSIEFGERVYSLLILWKDSIKLN